MDQTQKATLAAGYGLFGLALLIYAQYSYYIDPTTTGLPFLLSIAATFTLSFVFLAVTSSSRTTPPSTVQALRWKPLQPAWVGLGLAWMFITFVLAGDGLVTVPLVIIWFSGIVYWWLILGGGQFPRLDLTFSINQHTLLVMAFVMLGGVTLFFRLDTAPFEMLPDHRWKLLDVLAIQDGDTRLYYMYSYGREPLHFYFTFLLSRLFEVNFLTLKLSGALLSFGMLLALYGLGRQIGGKHLGLMTLGLAAGSLWLMIYGRSGFRAATSLLPTVLYLLFLWRAFRHGHRLDFLLAGAALGISLYTYYSTRVLPLIAVAGFLLCWLNTPRDKRRALTMHFVALVMIAFMIYVPLFSFWVNFPEDYWRRSDMLQTGFDVGLFARKLLESAAVFNLPLDPFMGNRPIDWGTTGPVIAALWPVGLLLWGLTRMRQRDWLGWLLPITFAILILPSALAFTAIDTPSGRRAILAFPVVTLFAGYALTSVFRLAETTRWRAIVGRMVAACIGGIIAVGVIINWGGYFDRYVVENRLERVSSREVASVIENFYQSGNRQTFAYLMFEQNIVWLDAELVQGWLDLRVPEFPIILGLNNATCDSILRDNQPNIDPVLLIFGDWRESSRDWVESCFEDYQVFSYRYRDRPRFFYVYASGIA